MPVNCDIGWLTYVADKMMHGKILYRDFFEINPPLILSLHVTANYFARILSSDQLSAFNFVVCVLTLFSYFLSLAFVKPLLNSQYNKYLFVVGLLIYYFILPLNGSFFGEREHLLIIFVTPYIIESYLRLNYSLYANRNLAPLSLAFMLFGILLKPYYLVLFAAIELAWLQSDKYEFSKRAFIYILLFALSLIYIVGTYLLFPYYFSTVLPIGLRAYFGHRMLLENIISSTLSTNIFFGCILLLLAFYSKSLRSNKKLFWIYILLAALLMPLIQFKGWAYTYYPLRALCFLTLVFILNDLRFKAEWKDIFKYKLPRSEALYLLAFTSLLLAAIIVSVSDSFTTMNNTVFYLKPFSFFLIVLLAYLILARKTIMEPLNLLCAVCGLILIIYANINDMVLVLSFINFTESWISIGVILLVGGWVCFKLRLSAHHFKYIRQILLIVMFTLYAIDSYCNVRTYNYWQDGDKAYRLLKKVVEQQVKQDDSIFIFNTNLYPAFPLVNYAKVNWASRFHHLWMFPAFYEKADANNPCYTSPKYDADKKFVYNALYEDLSTANPKLIIFDNSPEVFIWSQDTAFNWNTCIAKENKNLDQFIKQHYVVADEINLCSTLARNWSCTYKVYKRRDDQKFGLLSD